MGVVLLRIGLGKQNPGVRWGFHHNRRAGGVDLDAMVVSGVSEPLQRR